MCSVHYSMFSKVPLSSSPITPGTRHLTWVDFRIHSWSDPKCQNKVRRHVIQIQYPPPIQSSQKIAYLAPLATVPVHQPALIGHISHTKPANKEIGKPCFSFSSQVSQVGPVFHNCLEKKTPLLINRTHLLINRTHPLVNRTYLLITVSLYIIMYRTYRLITNTDLMINRTYLLIKSIHASLNLSFENNFVGKLE